MRSIFPRNSAGSARDARDRRPSRRPEADVEVTVGPEREMPAVVIRERLRDERGAAPAQVERDRTGSTPGRERRDRRKRATTVSPAALVKLTKNRRGVGVSGGNASPSSPCSPADAITATRRGTASAAGLRTTRILPSCSTTNCTDGVVGSCTNSRGKWRPLTNGWTRNCAVEGAATAASSVMPPSRRHTARWKRRRQMIVRASSRQCLQVRYSYPRRGGRRPGGGAEGGYLRRLAASRPKRGLARRALGAAACQPKPRAKRALEGWRREWDSNPR